MYVFYISHTITKMEQERNQYPDDNGNRIQKMYNNVNINTIFNRTKIQNIKHKFWKYVNYLIKYEQNIIQPTILRLQQSCWKYKMMDIQELRKVRDDPTSETYDNFIILRREYGKCSIEISRYITLQIKYNNIINNIYIRIKQIKTHQNYVRKHYKKCEHCAKMNMVTKCGCKSKHNLCSECIYDKTECPVCKEHLGLVHCYICLEYKKELVDVGCDNNHKTCKECMDEISDKKIAKCPYCRVTINL